jgi:hypothetical protein
MQSTLTNEQYLDAYRRVQAGERPAAVARSLGVHRNNLYRLIKRRGACVPEQRPQLQMPTDPAVLGYIAGIVDGEGSIYKRSQDGHWHLKVGMTDRPLIEWLAAFGGRFYVESRPEGRKTPYTWCVSRRVDLRHALTALLPYLRVKRELAVLALREEG